MAEHDRVTQTHAELARLVERLQSADQWRAAYAAAATFHAYRPGSTHAAQAVLDRLPTAHGDGGRPPARGAQTAHPAGARPRAAAGAAGTRSAELLR